MKLTELNLFFIFLRNWHTFSRYDRRVLLLLQTPAHQYLNNADPGKNWQLLVRYKGYRSSGTTLRDWKIYNGKKSELRCRWHSILYKLFSGHLHASVFPILIRTSPRQRDCWLIGQDDLCVIAFVSPYWELDCLVSSMGKPEAVNVFNEIWSSN